MHENIRMPLPLKHADWQGDPVSIPPANYNYWLGQFFVRREFFFFAAVGWWRLMCGRGYWLRVCALEKLLIPIEFNANGSAYKAACTCEIWKRKIRVVSLPFVPHSSTPSVSQVLCRRSQIGGKVRCVFFFSQWHVVFWVKLSVRLMALHLACSFSTLGHLDFCSSRLAERLVPTQK